ncbi:hypothetical protein Poly24_53520 [Rosistilla carotiformis]|uniref:DUF368 domain-containing protein n=2 Tax=Rosistilla carotiformis TaxID=2528017 RepID=A0A518K1D2_9BACT|nr:hypothetical protein Poly24_53520 [Rosistilla carotiformis]
MGAADSVPGVSGGTVALILGHYHRLVAAISHFDSRALAFARSGQWRRLVTHIDLRFLIALGMGVGIAILSLASLLHWLLENKLPGTLAVFMGLIIASIWIVARQIRSWSPAAWGAMVLGTSVGYVISSLSPLAGEPGYLYLFFSGVIAITAMILPGISGSFVLVLLGVYHHVIGLVKALPRGDLDLEGFIEMVVFATGCAIGLASFSRVLRWLLEHYQNVTFACLLGLMVGSLKRVWPLQQPTPETINEKFSHRVFEFVPVSEWSQPIVPLLLLGIGAATLVLVLEWLSVHLYRSQQTAVASNVED